MVPFHVETCVLQAFPSSVDTVSAKRNRQSSLAELETKLLIKTPFAATPQTMTPGCSLRVVEVERGGVGES